MMQHSSCAFLSLAHQDLHSLRLALHVSRETLSLDGEEGPALRMKRQFTPWMPTSHLLRPPKKEEPRTVSRETIRGESLKGMKPT